MIREHFRCQPHTLLYLYDSLIHGCMGESSLSHLKSPSFFFSLFGSDYRTWDPHLCHWSIFYWSLEACMHLENGGLLTWRYKHLHEFFMRHLLDVHIY